MAQSTNSGDIRGSVTDPSGALIPGVTITVLNVDTGVSKDFVTNHDGLYDTSSIVTGRYQITFTKEGFQQLVRGPVTVQVGFTGVNAQLKIGSTTQQVVITSNVPLLDSETGEQQTTLEANPMAQLPNVGTNWEKLHHSPSRHFRFRFQPGRQQPGNPGQFVAAMAIFPITPCLRTDQ